jgi:hypothetical protein
MRGSRLHVCLGDLGGGVGSRVRGQLAADNLDLPRRFDAQPNRPTFDLEYRNRDVVADLNLLLLLAC